jgi:hypothetical protein
MTENCSVKLTQAKNKIKGKRLITRGNMVLEEGVEPTLTVR